MKVGALREYLSKLDQEMDVLCYSEDERFIVKNQGFVLLDILAVNTANGERLRLEDGTPYLKFRQGPKSAVMVTLEVTSDF